MPLFLSLLGQSASGLKRKFDSGHNLLTKSKLTFCHFPSASFCYRGNDDTVIILLNEEAQIWVGAYIKEIICGI